MEQTVGRYHLKRRLAAGGMGEVYLAAQAGPEGFAKIVALKRMLPNMSAERELVKLFLHEARLVAKLSHRGIAQVIELGEDREGYFAALEFVPGPSVAVLVDRLRETHEKLPPPLALDIAAQVADALGYAHDAVDATGLPLQIVHRDVSPQNILLSVTGDVKLIDFGVAKSTVQAHATNEGGIKGKLAYMSPEQIRGQALDGRSDLFSLGIVLYEMLTGSNPFLRADPVQTLFAIQNEQVPSLLRLDPRLGVCDAMFRKVLAKNPAERFRNGHELHDALSLIKGRFPAAPKRLGSFVTERFGREVSDLTRSLGNTPSVVPLINVVEQARADAAVDGHASTVVRERPLGGEPIPLVDLPDVERQSTTAARAFLGQPQLEAPPRLGSPLEPQPVTAPVPAQVYAPPEVQAPVPIPAPVPAETKPAPAKPTPAKPTPAKPTPAKSAPAKPTPAKPTPAISAQAARLPAPPRREAPDMVRAAVALVSALTVLVFGLGAWAYFHRVDSAIDQVAHSSRSNRAERMAEARRLIAEEKNPATANYYRGRLEDAQGRSSMAVSYFRTAINGGNSSARRQLVEMLSSPSCEARQVAAQAIAEMKIEEARSKLEKLARSGGKDDSDAPIVGGCDSREAAADALRRLKRP